MAYIETKVNNVRYNTEKELFTIFHGDTAVDAFSIDELTTLVSFYVKHSREVIDAEINNRTITTN